MKRITSDIYTSVRKFIVKYRRSFVSLIHIFQLIAANFLAYFIRFEGAIPRSHFDLFLSFLPILVLVRMGIYIAEGMYKDLWRYSSVGDLVKIIRSVTLGSVVFFAIVRGAMGDIHYPRSIYILDWLLLIMLSGGTRLLIRVFREYMQQDCRGKRTLLIGAGDAGEMILRDMKNNPNYSYDPIGFIDDDITKKGLVIHGLPIFGPRSMMREVIEKYEPEEILISISTLDPKGLRDIFEYCKPFSLPIKALPALSDILEGKYTVSQIKPLSLEDLLQREPIKTDIQTVKDYIYQKAVLVTGAGGSIGSELCRQIVAYNPSYLIMFDRYENGLFAIDLELQSRIKKGDLPIKLFAVVGDMRDHNTIEYLFQQYAPNIVFHAAAHKHVPLMEQNPLEAVKNNIFGTRNLIKAASRYKAENFVMISTDKAVNPTNIMGATKRVAEYLAMNMNHGTTTKYTTVRFGNVLGSNGSVVHIFRDQLKKGGPITVTHPEIKRYFMLIPEAVQLVLIAASAGKGGEIFVLDMGDLIKITELAENLIRLSGFVPHEDIKITYTGLRPGEKLYEELFDESEAVINTNIHSKVRSAIPNCVPSNADMDMHITALEKIISANAADEVIPELKKIVPNFKK